MPKHWIYHKHRCTQWAWGSPFTKPSASSFQSQTNGSLHNYCNHSILTKHADSRTGYFRHTCTNEYTNAPSDRCIQRRHTQIIKLASWVLLGFKKGNGSCWQNCQWAVHFCEKAIIWSNHTNEVTLKKMCFFFSLSLTIPAPNHRESYNSSILSRRVPDFIQGWPNWASEKSIEVTEKDLWRVASLIFPLHLQWVHSTVESVELAVKS